MPPISRMPRTTVTAVRSAWAVVGVAVAIAGSASAAPPAATTPARGAAPTTIAAGRFT